MNLLILKVNHLGDNVVFVPVVQALRAAFPKARLHLVSTPAEAILYRGVLAASDIFAPAERLAFNHAWRQQPWSVPGWMLRFAGMRADGCLVSYDQGNFAHLINRWFGGDVRVGANMHYVRVRQSITHEVPPPADWNVVRWNWAMGRKLAQTLDPNADWPDAVPAPDLRHLLTTTGPAPRKAIVIHAGSKMAIRQWPLARFAELAERLARDHQVVWVDRLETRGVSLPSAVTTVSPASVRELAQLVAGARLYIGNNSGPMHLANAFGTPGVILSGPSSYGWDPYWYPDRWTVLRHPHLACLPCESPAGGVDRCTNAGEPMACLNYWTVDLVEAAVRQRLNQAIN